MSNETPTAWRKPAASKVTRVKSEDLQLDPGPPIDAGELNRFISLRHRDPHQILGNHKVDGGIVIRAFRPNANLVEVQVGRKKPQPMIRIHEAGLFALFIPGLELPSYRFQVHYSGTVYTVRDPYSFLPTLGEVDLHLFGEGKHEAIYQKLGAHPLKIGA